MTETNNKSNEEAPRSKAQADLGGQRQSPEQDEAVRRLLKGGLGALGEANRILHGETVEIEEVPIKPGDYISGWGPVLGQPFTNEAGEILPPEFSIVDSPDKFKKPQKRYYAAVRYSELKDAYTDLLVSDDATSKDIERASQKMNSWADWGKDNDLRKTAKKK